MTDRSTRIFAVTATVVVAMLLLAVGVYAYDEAQSDRIAPGVRIGGVDVGGRSVDEARSIIRRDVVAPLTKPLTVTFEDRTFKLTSKQLDQRADVEGMLDEAVSVSREGGLFDRLGRYVSGSAVNEDLVPRVTYSRQATDEFVAHVASKVNRQAENATLIPAGDSITPTEGSNGIELKRDVLRRRLVAEITSPATAREVKAPVAHTKPEVTRDELAETYPVYVTVDRANYTLRLFKNLKLVEKYPIAVGQIGLETPAGLYHIVDKQVDPTWNVPNSDWAGDLAGQSIPPGPSNPLKARWMGIYNGAGIHGTDDIGSLGSAASHGCVRMAIPDVIELYDQVPPGSPIYIS